jgi:hypothetical protein
VTSPLLTTIQLSTFRMFWGVQSVSFITRAA